MLPAGGNGNWGNCSARYLNANNPSSNTNRNYAGGLQKKEEKTAGGIPRQKCETSRTVLMYEEIRNQAERSFKMASKLEYDRKNNDRNN